MLSAISWTAVYFVVWWTTLFAVLPFGARGQAEDAEIAPGTEPGAPSRARMGRLFLITTAVSAVVFAGLYLVITRNLFGLDDIPFLPRFERVS
ncbi:DUF1467 family protein [Chelatococcus sambhunathii]|uniref:DUF1467 family protein n=1 Tax=Chelatococcus sambhunathii TaxID=363953 RepID=A0ABU1DJJ9_9HYPH|nr:DUF1467 family protein [Chelatococcus sambhunathii]MDR4308309.1 DUF1467 family protein [Chelatococcus sambhunathii]